MKKRLLATLMAAAMAATALAGCGSDGSGTSNGGAEKTDGTEGSAAATVDNGETYNIDMQIATWRMQSMRSRNRKLELRLH